MTDASAPVVPQADQSWELTSEIQTQAIQLANSVSIPSPSAVLDPPTRSLRRSLLGASPAKDSSSGTPAATLWPTVVGNASCYPFGAIKLCTFPSTVKMTQADWMFTCWEAGLQPFGIYTYSQLYMLTWGSQVVGVPVGAVQSIVAQVG